MLPASHISRTALFLLSRLVCLAFLLLTSAYCVLAYTPFAYYGFIHPPLMPWVGEFAHDYGFLYCGVLLIITADLALEFRKSKVRSSLAGFVLANLAFSVYQIVDKGLTGLSPNIISYAWSLIALFPLLWLATIDRAGCVSKRPRQAPHWTRPALNLTTYILCGVVVAAAFNGTALLRQVRDTGTFPPMGNALAVIASFAAHVLIFGIVGGVIGLLRLASRKMPRPDIAAYLLHRMWLCALIAFALYGLLLPSISFDGMRAAAYCCLICVVLIFYADAVLLKLGDLLPPPQHASVPPRKPKWILVAGVPALCGIAYAIPVLLGPTDWDFDLQKTAVLAVWSVVIWFVWWSGFRVAYRSLKVWLLAGVVVILAGFAPYRLRAVTPDWHDALASYAGWDMSFKTASEVLARSVPSASHAALYQFLKRNSNLRQPVAPAKLSLSENLKRTAGEKPNIFIFVIDSLRQDYVSPYNPQVDFTPEIGKFAQDSIVFQNAFTRYGGTALAEPSIWSGVMLPHKQFVEPFYPVDNLQQLLETDGYHSYISVDVILRQILRITPSITKLDADTKIMSNYERARYEREPGAQSLQPTKKNDRSWSNLDFVATLNELEGRIAQRKDVDTPIFAYTQPQNIHTIPLEESWLGSTRRQITIRELRKVDAAFGKFIRFLQAQGLYENSIVILTSDHGDAYGEFGRFGHADFIFPQVMRIPLIIHLPPQIRKKVVWDSHRIAFSLDITPSLYYLLGHYPTLDSDLAGRPLFTRSLAEQQPYQRSHYLIASSYAPVYGILSDNGEKLFIVDAVNRESYFYDLLTDPAGARNLVTSTIQSENDKIIRAKILAIEKAYGVNPEGASAGGD